jgi:hypothetical protein
VTQSFIRTTAASPCISQIQRKLPPVELAVVADEVLSHPLHQGGDIALLGCRLHGIDGGAQTLFARIARAGRKGQ